MIEPIPGWSCELRAGGVLLVPPEGPAAGTLRYLERVRPLRRMVDVLRAYGDRVVSPIEHLATVEGEHAAFAVVDGEHGELAIGAVFADDFYSLLVGPGRFREVVRDRIRRDTHMLGARRRRFVHGRPAGWQGFFAGPMHVHWIPLDFPRNGSSLSVFPALPAAGSSTDLAESLVEHHAAGRPIGEPEPITSAAGLSGRWWLVDGGETLDDVVVLEDERYAYPLLLKSPLAQHGDNVDLLRRVVDSVEPIPGGSATAALVAASFDHWIH